jgi:hypothetical protein
LSLGTRKNERRPEKGKQQKTKVELGNFLLFLLLLLLTTSS